ncbi:MAG TPA: 4'-phosphopantetheinyl transferase superfamily protein [Actinocrinis sp.]|uniref:4'-phosphopantetheinyl transferase family protein n=1 Tax=Actinocrinis sp. TaxID=1920516 RepID=UPI002DDCE7B6|nr:4'-phosphopantetheinyl transferase superfamily protein [Actinocrinis sp.]HEV3171622.1 4'-phosphopantetheinyl transferase superfamily protein [Actinocrinis sp.]
MSGDVDVVDVWLIGDGTPHPELELLYPLLDPAERQRADTAISQEDREEFIVAHAALRYIVGGRLGVPPEQVRWTIGPHGKPEVRGADLGPRVNLSHSRGLCMVAMTQSRRVGVDVQGLISDSAATSLARRFFPVHEARLVAEAAADEGRVGQFARLWARKEAVVKAAGFRLTQGLAVPVHGVGPVTVELVGDGRSQSYRVADIETPPGHRAAVALAGDEDFQVALRRWTWPGVGQVDATTHPQEAVQR